MPRPTAKYVYTMYNVRYHPPKHHKDITIITKGHRPSRMDNVCTSLVVITFLWADFK